MASSQEEVTLLGATGSPFVCRVHIALKLKGVEYKYVEENLRNKSELLLKSNPVHKKVPVFIHNEKPIAESLVIVEYIDETWKNNPILPSDPYQRALARFWSKFIDDKVFGAAWKSVFTADEKEREKNVEEAIEALQFLENEIKDKKFFGGEEIGLVDIAAVYIAFWVPMVQEIAGLELFTSEKFPKLHNWSQEFLNHPIVKESLPPRDPVFSFFKGLYESLFGAAMASSHEEVTLLGAIASAFACRVKIALKLKGVKYKYVEENLRNKSELLLKSNPVHKKIPVFIHNEKPIAESLVIVEYIDETWKNNPILPSDLTKEPWLVSGPNSLMTSILGENNNFGIVDVARESVFTVDEKEREKNVTETYEGLQFLENELKDKKFFGGEEVGLVDIAGVYIAFWVPFIQEIAGLKLLTSEKFPKLYKWSQEFVNHPVLKGVEYNYVEKTLFNKSDLLLKYNPKPIAESLVIAEYINETWKNNPILPSDPYQRALAQCEKNVEETFEALQFHENELKDKKFFGGEEFGLVDIVVVYIAFWVPILLSSEKFPQLYKWSQEFVNHPIVKEIETSLGQGPVYFNCYPNKTVSRMDRNILDSLFLNIHFHGLDMKERLIPAALIYRIQYKVMNTCASRVLLKPQRGETTLFITDMTKVNVSLPRTIKWDEVTLPKKWVMDKATPEILRKDFYSPENKPQRRWFFQHYKGTNRKQIKDRFYEFFDRVKINVLFFDWLHAYTIRKDIDYPWKQDIIGDPMTNVITN
ncbi:putative glutathione S-transferase [Glycine soja]